MASTPSIRISFCTTCKDRLHQLTQTFDENLSRIMEDVELEWLILNFNSTDGLHEYMMERLPKLPSRVAYAIDSSGRPWHLSVAKNIAHKLASGAIVANLDCDNFISRAAEQIDEAIQSGADVVHMGSGISFDGTCGRIGLRRDVFFELGGYDEALYPMGYQDLDLLARAAGRGFRVVRRPCAAGCAIPNTKAESVGNCQVPGLTWRDFDERNTRQSMANIAQGRFAANAGRDWGHCSPLILRGGGDRVERAQVG